MSQFTHVATSSKLLLSKGFTSESAAKEQADEWKAQAPRGLNDCESGAQVYSWAEHCEICRVNEVDPLEVLDK